MANIPFLNNAYFAAKVGIGTASPGNTLHVYKNATIGVITSPTVANAGFRVQDSGANMYVDGNSFVLDSTGYLTTTGSNDFDIGTNSTSRIKIKGSGNVGIGTTSPQYPLHVAGSSSVSAPTGNGVLMGLYAGTYGHIQMNGSSGSYIDFSQSGVDHKGRILYDNGSNYLRLDTNGTEKMRINSGGTVLINATTPRESVSKFSVQGGMSEFETTLTNNDDWQNSPISILERANIGSGSTADKYAPNLNFHWGGVTSKSLWMGANGHLSFGEYSSTGVPSTNGTFKAGNLVAASAITGNTGTFTGLVSGITPVAAANFVTKAYADGLTPGAGVFLPLAGGTMSGNIVFNNNIAETWKDNAGATTRMMILNSANIAYIGPVDTYAGGPILYGTSADVTAQVFYTGASERMRVTDAGNVGIGTTSPSSKLQVSGDAYVTGQFGQGVTVANKIAAYGGEFRSSGASAQIFFGRSGSSVGSGAIGADSTYVFKVWTIPGFGNPFVIKQDGNVGIGTTNPSEKLTVAGNVESQNTIVLNYNNAGNKWQQLFDGSNGWNLRYNNGSSWSSNYINVNTSGNATFAGNVTATNILTVAGAATGNPYLQFTQGGSQKAYIQYVDSGDSFELQSDNQFVVRTGGSTVALTINSSQNATFAGQLTVANGIEMTAGNFNAGDGERIRLGNSSDLQIYHDGSDSYIQDGGTGNLLITSNGASVQINKGTTENMAEFIVDGPVRLYDDSNKKLETRIVGVGTATTAGGTLIDGWKTTTQANAINDTTIATTAYVNNKIGLIPAGLQFEGTWDASTGNPPSASPENGQFWIVSVAGSTSLSGITDWKVGDWAIYVVAGSGTDGWQKVDNSSVLDGSGTGQSVTKWDGSGTSNTLTDGPITFSSNDSTFAGDLYIPNKIIHVGDEDTWMQFETNVISLRTGGSDRLTLTNSLATISEPLLIEGVLNYTGLEVKGTGASRPSVNLSNATTGILGQVYATESSALVFATTTSGTTALTLDSSQNATFAGDVNITQTTDVGVLNTTNLDNGSAVGLSLTYPTSNVAAGDGLAIAIGIAGRGRSYIANSNLTTNLDASNLAFYTESGGVIGERMIINQDGKVGIGTTSPIHPLYVAGDIGQTDGSRIWFRGSSSSSATGAQSYVYSNGLNLQIKGDDNVQILGDGGGVIAHFDYTGKVGIGNTGPNYKLSVSGGIEAGGVVTYSKVAGSLNTTGYAIAGLGTVFNGASAFFTFTASGGTGQYQRVVYSCAGVGTNWVVYKVIDEGTNVLDIEASATSAATIVFTFKTRSGTQAYSPRVVIQATGHSIISTYA